ncbi:MAG TPA: histidine phosphatase family protein [Verrucomicrobiae bacterium]
MSLQNLYLVRHGETAWSLSGQHTGRSDIPLTAHGEQQAANLAGFFKSISLSQVFTSPRLRARRTCELAGLGDRAVVVEDLAEWDYGDYDGRLAVDIRKDRPDWNIYYDGCPNGESPDQIVARADRLIVRLRGMSGNIALFSHGHFGRVLATRWLGLLLPEAKRLAIDPATVGILGYEADQRPAILQWNLVPVR